MTGLLQKSLVDDDAEALVAVADGVGEAVLIGEVEGVSGHLIPNVGVGEVVAVLAPSINGALVANLEHGGSLALVHLGGEGLLIGAGGGGDYLHGNAGLLGVGGGNLLPCLICLGLEVEVVNGALRAACSGGLFCGSLGFFGGGVVRRLRAAGAQRKHHYQSQKQCNDLFHLLAISLH